MESNGGSIRNITIGKNYNPMSDSVMSPDQMSGSLITNGQSDSTVVNTIKSSNSVQSASMVIGNLQPYRRYVVTIQSRNSVGTSDPTSPLTFITDEEAPGGPPLNLQLTPLDASSIKVWYLFSIYL